MSSLLDQAAESKNLQEYLGMLYLLQPIKLQDYEFALRVHCEFGLAVIWFELHKKPDLTAIKKRELFESDCLLIFFSAKLKAKEEACFLYIQCPVIENEYVKKNALYQFLSQLPVPMHQSPLYISL